MTAAGSTSQWVKKASPGWVLDLTRGIKKTQDLEERGQILWKSVNSLQQTNQPGAAITSKLKDMQRYSVVKNKSSVKL